VAQPDSRSVNTADQLTSSAPTIRARVPTRPLGVRAGSAGTLLTRRTEDVSGRCVEYARDVYRADRASFEVSELLGSTGSRRV
jgi:DNA-binding GntR family transcriptional regulator